MKRQVKELCAKVGVKIEFQTKMKSKQYCEVLKHGPKILWHFSLRSAVCMPFPWIWSLPTVDWWSSQWPLQCRAWVLPCRRPPLSVFCCCSGPLFLVNIPSCLIYELLTDRRVLKSPVTTGGLPINPFSSISFCPMYFDTLLSDTYTLGTFVSFLENWPLYHYGMPLFIPDGL